LIRTQSCCFENVILKDKSKLFKWLVYSKWFLQNIKEQNIFPIKLEHLAIKMSIWKAFKLWKSLKNRNYLMPKDWFLSIILNTNKNDDFLRKLLFPRMWLEKHKTSLKHLGVPQSKVFKEWWEHIKKTEQPALKQRQISEFRNWNLKSIIKIWLEKQPTMTKH
jgi:hypothetical protein